MHSFRRLALLLALLLPALSLLRAESSSSSSNPATPTASQDSQGQAQQPPQTQSQPQLSVQARIKARREQRRVTAIHEIYDHLYEGYLGAGYLRFTPGATLQRVNEYDWNGGFTRYFNERLGVTVDGRGYYGTPFIEPMQGDPPAGSVGLTKPAISQYAALIGPTYRFYLQPRYSISGRVMGGYAQGNFTGDTNGYGTLGVLYPDASTYAASAAMVVEYNLSPSIGLRVAPEYFLTGFGSTLQNNLGFTAGIAYRFGKQ
ncbi:MAG: hypothetical protein ABR898_00130 [Terracidiphilus sp.]|jgi:hypothetical protein